MKVENLLATRTSNIKASAIRELLKIATSPGMISLGGGLPSPTVSLLKLFRNLPKKCFQNTALPRFSTI